MRKVGRQELRGYFDRFMTAICEGAELESLKLYLADSWGVGSAIMQQGCVICKPHGICDQLYRTEAGLREYRLTGVCEVCFDEFMLQKGCTFFRDLSLVGSLLMKLWLVVARVKRSVSGLPSDIVAGILSGTFKWPQVRQYVAAGAAATE